MTTTIKPLRYSPKQVAALLNVDVITVRKWIKDGRFDALHPNGKGQGKRIYIRTDELEAYVEGGWNAVNKLRAAKAKKK